MHGSVQASHRAMKCVKVCKYEKQNIMLFIVFENRIYVYILAKIEFFPFSLVPGLHSSFCTWLLPPVCPGFVLEKLPEFEGINFDSCLKLLCLHSPCIWWIFAWKVIEFGVLRRCENTVNGINLLLFRKCHKSLNVSNIISCDIRTKLKKLIFVPCVCGYPNSQSFNSRTPSRYGLPCFSVLQPVWHLPCTDAPERCFLPNRPCPWSTFPHSQLRTRACLRPVLFYARGHTQVSPAAQSSTQKSQTQLVSTGAKSVSLFTVRPGL